MHFLCPLLGFTKFDHQRNADIREGLQVENTGSHVSGKLENEK
jgi:hypothetical protein